MQSQIDRKDKQATQAAEDAARLRDKMEKLLKTIDELQASESTNQISARRAERELQEEKERALRLERELDGWKGLRMEKGSVNGSVRLSMSGLEGGRRSGIWMSDDTASLGGTGVEVPKRKSSISRAPSLTKGFL